MDTGAVDVPRRAKKRRSGAGGIQHVPSPFRLAERQYKLYRDPKLQKRQCFSTAVDFRELGANTDAHREKIVLCKEIAAPGRGEEAARTLQVFGHSDRPGFFFIPGALAPREQLQWARQCLAAYPTAPHHTNLGILPFNVWQAHANKDRRASKEGPPGSKEDLPGSNGSSGTVTGKRRRTTAEEPASLLQATVLPPDAAVPPVSKLRWATLGYHYDWTANVYHEGAHWHSPFPQELAEMVTAFTNDMLSEPFTPEAAIVNYYQPGLWRCCLSDFCPCLQSTETMLKAHQDESEFTFDAPIVSFSIGCECIFLLGGTTTDEEPTAVRFRSGDLMFMSGDSRVAFHGA